MLTRFHERTQCFVERIKQALELEEDKQHIIPHRNTVVRWIQEEGHKLREEREKLKHEGFFTGLLNRTGIGGVLKKLESSESALEKVREIMSKEPIEFSPNMVEDL